MLTEAYHLIHSIGLASNRRPWKEDPLRQKYKATVKERRAPDTETAGDLAPDLHITRSREQVTMVRVPDRK